MLSSSSCTNNVEFCFRPTYENHLGEKEETGRISVQKRTYRCFRFLYNSSYKNQQGPKIQEHDDSGSSEDECEEITQHLNTPGIDFWIVFDWPQFVTSCFEQQLSKTFMEAGVNLISCTAIRPRG